MATFQLREDVNDWWDSYRCKTFGPDTTVSQVDFESLFLE